MQNFVVQQITSIFVVTLLAAVISTTDAHAHNPHDPVQGLGISPSFSNDHTLFLAAVESLLLGATLGGNVYRSTNRGNSWQSFSTGLSNLYLKEEFEIVKSEEHRLCTFSRARPR